MVRTRMLALPLGTWTFPRDDDDDDDDDDGREEEDDDDDESDDDDACGASHWGLRWNSLWSHDPRQACAEMGWGPRSSSGVCRNGLRGRVRTVALRPSVELAMGPQTV